MSILNIFKSRPQEGVITNPTVPQPIEEKNDKSPIDKYSDLWQKKEEAAPSASLIPAMNMDPAKLAEAAKKLDFVSQIPQESFTKAMNGDAQAFADVINKAVQMGFTQAVSAGAEVTKLSFNTAQTSLTENILPSAIRKQQIEESVKASNPVFQDPSISPMVDLVKDQLARQYPKASANEIASMATEYLTGFSQKVTGVTPQPVAVKNNPNSFQAAKEEDWTKFFQQ